METILKDGKIYTVPIFQRSYSWEKEQILDFWSDLIDLVEAEKDSYFIGSMVFTPHEEKNKIKILDGQQRFATILLFLAALRDVLKPSTITDASVWIDEIDRIIYTRDIPSLTKNPKLILNREDRMFFEEIVVHGNIRECKYHSHELIKNAYNFFKEEISKNISKDKEKFVESILDVIMHRLLMIRIDVDSDENANILFETLNDRGLELSVADLVKNYIFSVAGSNLENVVQLWKEIVDQVGDYNVSKFLRHFWLSSFGLVKKEELYKKLKKEVNEDNVKEFIQKLSEEATIYANLSSPTHEFWGDTEIEDMIENINILKVEQVYILLLALYKKFFSEKNTFNKLLRALINFVFRYNTICGFDPKSLESEYSKLAISVRNAKINDKEVIRKINELSPSREQFISSFINLEIKNKKLAKYILLQINNYLFKKQGKNEITTDINKVNLEHIIPLHPDEEWRKFLKENNIDFEKWIYKIGNMTILLKEYNKKIANKFFDKKREMYRKSELPLNDFLQGCKKFGIDEIKERQQQMAEIAEELWKN
ncbi:MAG: DUF262 domain-containing HNH endonuclease family protein [Candidatus Ratteibacteria bacterium]|nr:DUF262 domain-containing HNH endonuclease family protein [Candidatus Ratteibacteria bacterium]